MLPENIMQINFAIFFRLIHHYGIMLASVLVLVTYLRNVTLAHLSVFIACMYMALWIKSSVWNIKEFQTNNSFSLIMYASSKTTNKWKKLNKPWKIPARLENVCMQNASVHKWFIWKSKTCTSFTFVKCCIFFFTITLFRFYLFIFPLLHCGSKI